MPARLILTITAGPLLGTPPFVLQTRDVFLFGRHPDSFAKLPEDDNMVSRWHFALDVNPPKAMIRDLGSRNSTFVNDRWIGGLTPPPLAEPGLYPQEVQLRDGDEVRAGTTVFSVRVEAPLVCARCGEEQPLSERRLCASCMSVVTTKQSSTTPRKSPDTLPDGDDEPTRNLAALIAAARNRGEAFPPEVADFTVGRRIGVGGMGAVYEATRADGKDAAVKFMLPTRGMDERMRAMFYREVASMLMLRHPNLVEVYDYGVVGSTLWVAMERCSLGNLDACAARAGGWFSPGDAVAVAQQVLSALEFMHGHGYVHRDVKPENILITRRQDDVVTVKLSDLGLAHSFERAGLSGVTVTGQTCGSAAFMAPEQFTHYRTVGPSADLWSLTASIYYLLTGQLTRDFPEGVSPLVAVLLGRVIPIRERDASVPRRVAEVVDRALLPDPGQRYPTARSLAEALRNALAAGP